jgi:hypothetical protein
LRAMGAVDGDGEGPAHGLVGSLDAHGVLGPQERTQAKRK